MTGITKERAFEDAIEAHLIAHGWEHGLPTDYHAGLALDTRQLFAFIGATQQPSWDKLLRYYSNDDDEAQRRFAERLGSELDSRGAIEILRHGLEDRGVHFDLAYFRPAHGLNPDTLTRYRANRLSVSRQIRYAGDANALDLVLFCNGVPVATAELKNPITGQNVDHAIAQYRIDRDPRNVLFARRAVVHFAVDPHLVMMTTSLAGKDTSFLPFNRGDAPGELSCGKGNPANPSGHATSYLWEDVWARDAWLDILHRFIHVQQDEAGAKARAKRGGRLIFPRYHQWDAVQTLESHAKDHGAGHHYLVEHSAGSGKSNTIAWLAHRLASLHNAGDAKIFDKVVVITDRRILDKQLQDTIYQFEHTHGVVAKIEESSSQLADALKGTEAKIVVTTLQKFPFVVDELAALPERQYAIVIDEAHSSQTGEEAAEMRRALGKRAKDIPDDATPDDLVDLVAEELARARGRQPNLSLFAFTATPKARTLEIFGSRTTIDGEVRYRPFHVYSMRQAIEEGFILDVLRNYTTYQSYWRVANAAPDDPEVESRRAAAKIAQFAILHPEQVAQKAQIVVEHVRNHTLSKVGGRGKAMVVCSSRLHAVRLRIAVDTYLRDHGIGDAKALVAFSGTVTDPDTGAEFTEAKMNGFGERQTAAMFDSDDTNRILIVAEKFQTGFDQPLLHTMFVDKKLAGVHAVQTLSRLNRTRPGKDDTFVLDFVNDADEIQRSYEPFYETTLATETDPNLLFDARNELERFGVVLPADIDLFAAVYFDRSLSDAEAHTRLYSHLDPARVRFDDLDDDDQDAFRSVLHRFVLLYGLVSQILPLEDSRLEKRFQYCRLLEHVLPRGPIASVDLGELELTHLRVKPTGHHDIGLGGAARPLVTVTDGEPGPMTLPGMEPLSAVIQRVNEQFGLGLQEADRLHLESVAAEMIDDEDVQLEAAANTLDNFAISFDRRLVKAFVERMHKDEKLTKEFLDNPEFKDAVREYMVQAVYERAKVARQKNCPIGDLLGPGREDRYLEYKASLRWDLERAEKSKVVESMTIKTVAAFLNSPHGGTLLLGVVDDGSIAGLESDYATLRKAGKDDADLFVLHLGQVISNAVGLAAAANVLTEILSVDGHDICRVHVEPSGHPVTASVTKVNKKGQFSTHEAFFVRMNNRTEEFTDETQIQRYIAQRWGQTT